MVVDLSQASTYSQLHIDGAVHLDYGQIVTMRRPVGGLLPDEAQLTGALSAIGLTPDTHVIAYDDEGGGKACRFLWSLDVIGHTRYSLLNGGLHAWLNEKYPLTNMPATITPSNYQVQIPTTSSARADRHYILEHLEDTRVALLDSRSPAEFSGEKRFAERGGHIPGAVNMEWTEFMDQERNLRLKPDDELLSMLHRLGIRRDQTVVAYCQTHHRSAHTWFMLKHLGYHARGYEGSWSDWGNQPDTPIE